MKNLNKSIYFLTSLFELPNQLLYEGRHKINLDEYLSSLAEGVYFVKLTCNDVSTCKRIIKIK